MRGKVCYMQGEAQITYTAMTMTGPVPGEDAWWFRTPVRVGLSTRYGGGAVPFEAITRPFSEAGVAPYEAPPVPTPDLIVALGGIPGTMSDHVAYVVHEVGGEEEMYLREWAVHPGIDAEEACADLVGWSVRQTTTAWDDGRYVTEWANGDRGRGMGSSVSVATGQRSHAWVSELARLM